jgi:hypothetical protein
MARSPADAGSGTVLMQTNMEKDMVPCPVWAGLKHETDRMAI